MHIYSNHTILGIWGLCDIWSQSKGLVETIQFPETLTRDRVTKRGSSPGRSYDECFDRHVRVSPYVLGLSPCHMWCAVEDCLRLVPELKYLKYQACYGLKCLTRSFRIKIFWNSCLALCTHTISGIRARPSSLWYQISMQNVIFYIWCKLIILFYDVIHMMNRHVCMHVETI